jgi:hypothetical protein
MTTRSAACSRTGSAAAGRLVVVVVVVIVVSEVHLSAFLRSGSSRDVSSDSITGEALVGARSEILARYPQHAAAARTPATDPNEPGRAAAVARHDARWLRWTMG